MRTALSLARVRPDEGVLIGLTGLLVIAGLTLGAETALGYLVVGIPVIVAVSWWRPVYGFALLLGLVLMTEEFEIGTLAGDMKPLLVQALPLFRNLEDYTPFSFVYANAVELWLVLLAAVWLVQAIAARRLVVVPTVCARAWVLATATIGLTFAFGVMSAGDPKIALWEVRALGYLLGLAWLVPQLVERRRDLLTLLWVMVIALGLKAVQGLYRYVVVLRMQLEAHETFMAHEDPVMFVPLFFLLAGLLHYRTAPRLTRALLAGAPLMLAALVFTQRRVAYVTLVLCAAFFVIELLPAARPTFLRLALPAVVLGVAYVAVFAGSSSPLAQPIDRALSLFDPNNPSNLFRVHEVENLRHTIREHPWGIGFGHPYAMIHSLPTLDFPLWEYTPHNEILWIWVKAGTLGFILVMFFFARLVAEAVWTHRHLDDPLLRVVAAIIGLAIVNQLVVSYYELQLTYGRNMVYLGTLIGLLAPLQRLGGLGQAASAGARHFTPEPE